MLITMDSEKYVSRDLVRYVQNYSQKKELLRIYFEEDCLVAELMFHLLEYYSKIPYYSN